MIAPDDKRHGSVAGYIAGCRGDACRAAKWAYEKRRSHEARIGRPRRIDATGTHRRIRALMALGWPMAEIAAAGGWPGQEWVNSVLKKRKVLRDTANLVRDIYGELSMTLGPSDRLRSLGIKRGWPVPLAWDDDAIDNPDAQPYQPRTRGADPELHEVDPVIVERAMNGKRVKANAAERAEVIRRWLAAGKSAKSLEELQNWNVRRDEKRAAA